jgi:hypothetical protein
MELWTCCSHPQCFECSHLTGPGKNHRSTTALCRAVVADDGCRRPAVEELRCVSLGINAAMPRGHSKCSTTGWPCTLAALESQRSQRAVDGHFSISEDQKTWAIGLMRLHCNLIS